MYTLKIKDKNGNNINEIANHKGFNFSYELNRPGECSFTTNIDFTDKFTMANLFPYIACLDIFRYNTKVWSGVLSKISGNVGAETGSMTLNFSGYLHLLEKMRTGIGKVYSITDTKNSGTIVDDNTIGTVAWVNSSNAKVNDNVYATADLTSPPSVADSYSESNQSSNSSLSYLIDGNYQGQSITGDGRALNSCKFYLKKAGSPTGNAYAKIYAHSGTFGTTSIPTGAALATSDAFEVSGLTTAYQLINFNFIGANKITLVDGTKYVLTIEYPGGTGNVNIVIVGVDSTSSAHNGNFSYSFGDAWFVIASWDLCFYVFCDDTTSKTSHYLKATNFGFSVSLEATIKGILVEIEEKSTTTTTEDVVKIVKADGTIGTTNKSTGATLPNFDSYISYGGSSDLWGETWTFADINDADFGVVFATTGFGILSVDHIRITVYYTTGQIEGVYTAVDQGTILWAMLNNFQSLPSGNYGITLGNITTGILRDRTYSAFKNIYDAFIEMTEVIDGPDIEITIEKVLNIYARKGHRLNHVFEYGKNISDFSFSVDGDSIVNNSILIGAGEGSGMLYSVAHNMQSQEKYLLMQNVTQKSDVIILDTLTGYAQGEVNEYGEPTNINALKVMVQDDPPFMSYSTGDEIRVKVNDGWLSFDKFLRVKKISVDVNEEELEEVSVEFQ